MPAYIVAVAVSGTEYYRVEAESEQDAWNNWYDGEQTGYFDAHDYTVIDVEEVDD